jgi:hypothetical protein
MRAPSLRFARERGSRPTDSGEAPDLEAGQSGPRAADARRGSGRDATRAERSSSPSGSRANPVADGKGVAGVERRYGFVRREKL